MRLPALLCLVLAGCGEDECEALSDCEPNEVCVEGLCHRAQQGMGPIDAGIRRDSGIHPDASGSSMDASSSVDSGSMMQGDAGMPPPGMDASTGPTDAGLGALPITGDLGFVWVGELFDSETTSAFHAAGYLQRLDSATFDSNVQGFIDSEGSSCALIERRLTGGSITGFDAQEISVIPGPQPFASFSMYPVGNGVFAPIQDPVDRIFNKSITAFFQIYGTGNPGSVESMLVGVGSPPFAFEDPSYPRGSVIAINPTPQLRWVPAGLSDGVITVEVFDAMRELVLTCLIMDDGAYVIPQAAVSAFIGELPVAPAYLEIRYDSEIIDEATLTGGGTMPVLYRASQGLRYPVNLP